MDKRPPIYAHSISEVSTKIFCIGLAINSLVSPLYYGNLYDDPEAGVAERYLTYWYYTLNFVVLILFMFFREPIIKLFFLIKNKVKECKN